jgi:hypothetical protein
MDIILNGMTIKDVELVRAGDSPFAVFVAADGQRYAPRKRTHEEMTASYEASRRETESKLAAIQAKLTDEEWNFLVDYLS